MSDCVERLRSPKLAVRKRAEKQLVAWGTPILPIINSLDTESLDVEQRARLARIRCRLRRLEDDTPRSLATLLVNDHEHWTKLSGQLNARQFKLADTYLKRTGFAALPAVDSSPMVRIASKPE